ncbi:MAG TPA: hypothetical protein VMI54_09975 [Polyangiaceae bacterium]|nr:hypothetical protein [Polyangiaceae bacterium]
MFRRVFLGTALAAVFSVSSLAAHPQEPPEPHAHWCMLAAFQVTQVGSLYVSVPTTAGSAQRFVGAQLFVPAQPGLTPEWIRANLARHLADHGTSAEVSCPLDIPGVTTNVVSGGTGFWIQISSNDAGTAKEILNRARQTVR